MGQALQVFPNQSLVPHCHARVRGRKSRLRSSSRPNHTNSWSSDCRGRWFWCHCWLVHHCRLCGSACEASTVSGNGRSDVCHCCSARTSHRRRIHRESDVAMGTRIILLTCGRLRADKVPVLLHQSADRWSGGHRHLFVLQAAHERKASASDAQRKAAAIRSRRRSFDDEPAHFIHSRTPIWWSDASLEQRHSHWLVDRLRNHPCCLCRLGNVPKRICHDRTTTGELASAFRPLCKRTLTRKSVHRTLYLDRISVSDLLQRIIFCHTLLPSHLLPERPQYQSDRIRSQNARPDRSSYHWRHCARICVYQDWDRAIVLDRGRRARYHRLWPVVYYGRHDYYRQMDRVPDPGWLRSWCHHSGCSAECASPSPIRRLVAGNRHHQL